MICWVHGAFSSSTVFNYLVSQMPDHDPVFFEYSVETPLAENVAALRKIMMKKKCRAMVGHSLGGIMAAEMVRSGMVEQGVAIASPLGGFLIGNFIPFTRILNDTRSNSPLIRGIRQHEYDDKFLSIIARGFDGGDSDGVVGVPSQMALKTVKMKDINTNHFEVVLHNDTVKAVKEHLFS